MDSVPPQQTTFKTVISEGRPWHRPLVLPANAWVRGTPHATCLSAQPWRTLEMTVTHISKVLLLRLLYSCQQSQRVHQDGRSLSSRPVCSPQSHSCHLLGRDCSRHLRTLPTLSQRTGCSPVRRRTLPFQHSAQAGPHLPCRCGQGSGQTRLTPSCGPCFLKKAPRTPCKPGTGCAGGLADPLSTRTCELPSHCGHTPLEEMVRNL